MLHSLLNRFINKPYNNINKTQSQNKDLMIICDLDSILIY